MNDGWIKFEVWQDGVAVAIVSGPRDREDTLHREITRYALQYAEDGDVLIKGPLPDPDSHWATVVYKERD